MKTVFLSGKCHQKKKKLYLCNITFGSAWFGSRSQQTCNWWHSKKNQVVVPGRSWASSFPFLNGMYWENMIVKETCVLISYGIVTIQLFFIFTISRVTITLPVLTKIVVFKILDSNKAEWYHHPVILLKWSISGVQPVKYPLTTGINNSHVVSLPFL